MSPTRVLVMASSPLVRAGLLSMLAAAEASLDLEVVGEEGTPLGMPGETEQSLGPYGAEVVLVAGEEPLEETFGESLAAEAQALVVLSEEESVVFRLREMPLSGWAVVPPDTSSDELSAAIVAAARGLVILPKALSERLFEEGPVLEEPPEPLTSREEEVLELLSRGLPNKAIARELSISDHTVKFHVSSLYAKLGVGSRAEAVGVGARLGLITL